MEAVSFDLKKTVALVAFTTVVSLSAAASMDLELDQTVNHKRSDQPVVCPFIG